MLIDTHIHVWNFDKAEYEWLKNDTSILKRTYNLSEIETERTAVGITGGVLVQAANNLEDTDWMLEVAKSSDWIKGVVGWLPLTDTRKVVSLLEEKYLLNPYFKGVRHLIHDETDPKWLLQPAVLESLAVLAKYDLSYDVVGVLPEHIETVLTVAEKVPGLRMVFDHLNQPPAPGTEEWKKWSGLMIKASLNEKFYAKISGLGTTLKKGEWTSEDICPAVEFAVENFGKDRCMCGGDWPVSLLAGSYTKTWLAYKDVINDLLPIENANKLYYENAVRFYKLSD